MTPNVGGFLVYIPIYTSTVSLRFVAWPYLKDSYHARFSRFHLLYNSITSCFLFTKENDLAKHCNFLRPKPWLSAVLDSLMLIDSASFQTKFNPSIMWNILWAPIFLNSSIISGVSLTKIQSLQRYWQFSLIISCIGSVNNKVFNFKKMIDLFLTVALC